MMKTGLFCRTKNLLFAGAIAFGLVFSVGGVTVYAQKAAETEQTQQQDKENDEKEAATDVKSEENEQADKKNAKDTEENEQDGQAVKENTKDAESTETENAEDEKSIQEEIDEESSIDAPVMKSAEASFAKTIKVKWKKVRKAEGYILYRKKAKGKYRALAAVTDPAEPSYVDTSVKRNVKYSYKAAAYREKANRTVTSVLSEESVSTKVELTWPCPSSTRITSYFGPRKAPTRGASTYHKGIDIGATRGSSIVAVSAGKVIVATYSSSCGNYVAIDHGNGIVTYYMHASKLRVRCGQEVKAGQRIADVGSTGYATGPHLHFAITIHGVYKNPLDYLKM